MTEARKFLVRHQWLCALLLGAALLVKALVPAGFMPVVSNGVILVQLCSGQGPQKIAIKLPSKGGEQDHDEHKKAEAPCAFTGLSSPSLAAVDALLLAVALAFILATVFRRPNRLVLRRGTYLRPPAIGPPTT